MAKITFKANPRQVYNADGTPVRVIIKVPTLAQSHCDMAAFRTHAKYGVLANSVLFPNALSRIRREVFKGRDGRDPGRCNSRYLQVPGRRVIRRLGHLR